MLAEEEKTRKIIVLKKERRKQLITKVLQRNRFVKILTTENWVVVNKIPVTVNGILVTVGNQIFAD